MSHFRRLYFWVIASVVCVYALDTLQPVAPTVSAPRKPERARWTWNQPKAQITATGDLVWKPQPFKYEAGATVRYIDFDKGDDTNDGTSKTTPWKHHPWDAAASGKAAQCKGIVTYVFKRGVAYRGTITVKESGAPGNPLRLTSDPSWGTGEAVLCGSERVTGWKKGADLKEIPDRAKVWYADLAYLPRNVWVVKGKQIDRIPLARTPNWKVSNPEDVMSEWWTWTHNNWWDSTNVVEVNGHKAWLAMDTVHLTRDSSYYMNAIVRSEYGYLMGSPFPSRVEGCNPARKGIVFQGIWLGPSEHIVTKNRYYLEDKAQYLDTAGEFWFDRRGDSGRLYLRLPGDADPNTAVVEAGCRVDILAADSLRHVRISGLTLRFTNTLWDLALAGWGHKDVANAAVRCKGPAYDVVISNNRFEHVANGIRVYEVTKGKSDSLMVVDNEIRYTDHGAMELDGGKEFGLVRVLRNSLYMIGMRPHRQSHGHALSVNFPEQMEVAGNILDRCYGAGVYLFGGKSSGDGRDRPFTRNLVYNNRVTNALLAANDWGSIETWQGGPYYVYNNISGNPNGYWNWAYDSSKNFSARLGMAYYLDGGYKCWHFNNVAWGGNNDPKSPLCAGSAFYEATPTVENAYFNNTVYKFSTGSNWSPAGGRHFFLGNLWMDIGSWVFMHGRLKEDSKESTPAEYPYETMAYGRNVFYKIGKELAVIGVDGRQYADLPSFASAMGARKPLAGDVGILASQSPVKNAAAHDFRIAAGSAAIDAGVKMFVPWGLSRTVGEWNFRRNNADPAMIPDNHWYMAPYYVSREAYHTIPVFPLRGVNITAESFVPGALENWCPGALKLNGKDQFAMLANAQLMKGYVYERREGEERKKITVPAREFASPDIDTGNLLIEAYFQTDTAVSGCALVAKMGDSAGYQLAIDKTGGVTLALKTATKKSGLTCGTPVNDGRWHHVIAEVDRMERTAAIYVDGVKRAEGVLSLNPGTSLSNTADLLIGKNREGNFFAGSIDFLRIARSTLKESKTSIEELYDWEFDGPFLRDFAGNTITGKGRDAGAFEFGGK